MREKLSDVLPHGVIFSMFAGIITVYFRERNNAVLLLVPGIFVPRGTSAVPDCGLRLFHVEHFRRRFVPRGTIVCGLFRLSLRFPLFFPTLRFPIDIRARNCYNIKYYQIQFRRKSVGKIIVFANQKGGVGKTTSAVNVAASVGSKGKRVLLVDLDPQGNTSSGVGINKKNMKLSTYDVLIGRATAESCIVDTEFKNLAIMPSNISLAGAEFELVSVDKREHRLKNALNLVRDSYDYIFIDCPPSLGILTVNALAASDGVIVPMQCEYYSLEGLSQLMSTIKTCKRLYNPDLQILGILITMYNGRLNLSMQVMDELKKYYAGKLFRTTILRNVKLSEAPSYGSPIMYYDKHCKGAEAYDQVSDEIIERM